MMDSPLFFKIHLRADALTFHQRAVS
jgi:hypothetical protein